MPCSDTGMIAETGGYLNCYCDYINSEKVGYDYGISYTPFIFFTRNNYRVTIRMLGAFSEGSGSIDEKIMIIEHGAITIVSGIYFV